MTNHNAITPSQETQPTPEQILASATGFLKHFNVEVNPNTDREAFLDAVQKLDPLKSGDPRYINEDSPTEYNAETEQIIRDTFDAMGMSRTETPFAPGHYNAILVLGAARQAPADRLDYMLKALQSGQITTDAIVATGSVRPLGTNDNPAKSEAINVSNYAPNATIEGDLARAVAYGAEHDTTLSPDKILDVISDFVGTDPRNGRHFYADNERVMTQTFEELDKLGLLDSSSRIGAVTTQIYQPGASFDLANVATKFGVTNVFVAGNPSDPNIVAKRTVPTLFTEICRTIQKSQSE